MIERRQSSHIPVPPGPILVVGDIMCDHYVWGDVERISPEAPVQVLRWEREADRPGGAANAAMNLAALGCDVRLAGLVGDDGPGRWLMGTLKRSGIDTRGVITSRTRATTLKTRVIARGQHMLRIDRETRGAPEPAEERRIIAAIRRLKGLSGVVCSDYGKGVLSTSVLSAALSPRGRPFVLVDPKGRDFSKYAGADLLTPNEKELMDASNDNDPRVRDEDVVRRRARRLMRRLAFRAMLVTRGGNGMDLFEAGTRAFRRTHIPALQRHEVFDVTGAGDTVAAVLTMGAAAGLPIAEAARLANTAAGIVVGMVGTAVAEAETLARVLENDASTTRSKVLPPSAIAARLADARAQGATLVFASGSFDALHVSDLRRLQRARAQGDVLVVGMSDRSPKANEQAELLAALRFVDYVVMFSERTPARLIRALRPDAIA